MKTLPSARRLAVIVMILLGLVSTVIPAGVGAQGLQTCEDFGSPDIAQTVLDVDPSLAEFLDPDGNGIACDHEDDSTEDATDDPPGDGDDYLADIQDDVETVVDSLERYAEINSMVSDASATDQADMIAEVEDIAAGWSEYPRVAAEFEAPEGLEEVEDAYLDFADAVGEAGELWLTWWDIPAGDLDEDAAFDDFTQAYDAAWDEADNLTLLIDEAGDLSGPSEDPADDPANEPSGDGIAYVEDIQGELDLLAEQADRFLEINGLGADATRAEVDELNQIAADWADYPDVATNPVAPEGFEDIEDAYLDLAGSFGDAGELWEEYWAIPVENDVEEEVAIDAFNEVFIDAQDQIDEVQGLIDDPTADPADEPSGDADAYLDTVSEHAESVIADLDVFSSSGDEMITQEEIDSLFENFTAAPTVAASIDVPRGYDEVQDAYEDFTDHVASLPDLYAAWIDSGMSEGMEDPTQDPVFLELVLAIAEADDLYATLVDVIEEFETGAASNMDAPATSDDLYLADVHDPAFDNLMDSFEVAQEHDTALDSTLTAAGA